MAYAFYTERIGSELVMLDGASTVTGIIDLGGTDPNGAIEDYDVLEIKSGSKLKGALINVEETTLEIGDSNNKNSSVWDIVECDNMTATELEIEFDYGMTGTYVVCNKAASVEWSDAIKDNKVTLDLGDNRGEVTFYLDDSDNVYAADTFYDFELETKGNKMLLTVTEKI